MSCIVRNLIFAYEKAKGAVQLCGNCAADHHLCFQYIDCTILLLKSEISSLLPSSVAIQPGLCRIWSETPKTGFLMTWLKFYNSLFKMGWKQTSPDGDPDNVISGQADSQIDNELTPTAAKVCPDGDPDNVISDQVGSQINNELTPTAAKVCPDGDLDNVISGQAHSQIDNELTPTAAKVCITETSPYKSDPRFPPKI